MRLLRLTWLLVFATALISNNKAMLASDQPVAEPDPDKTAEFFGTTRPKREERRRIAENGCNYGWYAISRGYFYSAEGAFQKAIEIDPTCACGYFGMARLKRINKDDNGSKHFYLEAIKRNPSLESAENREKIENSNIPKSSRNPHTDAIAAAKMGWQAFGEKDYARALSFFEFARKQDPSFAPGYFGTAYVYSVQNKLDQAIDFYRESIKRDDSFAPAFGNLAYALLLKDHIDESKDSLNEALKRDPKQGDAVMNFAYYYASKGNWDMAKKYFMDAVARGAVANPDAAEDFRKHGIVAPATAGQP